MFRSLLRLRQFVGRYKLRLSAGIFAFGIARLLEASIPLALAEGIDRIADGRTDLLLPVVLIFAAVTVRFVVVSGARFLVRSAGIKVAFDLRQSLYDALQFQGARGCHHKTVAIKDQFVVAPHLIHINHRALQLLCCCCCQL